MKTPTSIAKSKLALALLACCAAFGARADYPSTVLSQGPAGYWRLNENTAPPPPVQATNSGTLGTAYNAFYVGDSPRGLTGPLAGGNGKAISLDGASQAVQENYAAALNPASFSIEAWLQPKSAAVNGGLLCALASMHSGNPRTGWLIYQSDGTAGGGTTPGWNFRMYNGANTAVIPVNAASGLNGTTNLTAGTWYHVVATYNAANSNAAIYVNGVLVGSGTASQAMALNTDSLFSIGARSDDGFLWPGEAAEVALYSSAIPASTVMAHYQAATTNAAGYGTQVIGDHPIVYFRFLEPAEPIAPNLGSLGAAANGTYIYNAMPGQPGPQSPAFPGFSASNTGVTFDGNSGYVRIPPLNLNTANATMSAWVNLNGLTDNPNAGIVFCDSGATQAGLKFDVSNPNGLSYNWSSDTAANFNSGLTIPSTGWAYLALVTYPDHAVLAIQDGTSFQFVTNFTTLGALPFSGFTLIGSDGGSTNLTFAGTIDEVAIFNRSLGLGELYTEYASAIGGLLPTVFVNPTAPGNQLFVGDSLNLSVDAGGTPSLTYFWRKTGTTVQSGTAPTFSIGSLALSDTANYDVIVSNSFGSVTSAVASITVNNDTSPNLVQGPANVTVYQGGTISLSVNVTGGLMHYYWFQNGTNLASFTGSTLTIPSAVAGNAGSYTVVCSNGVSSPGMITAGPASVVVTVPTAGTFEAAVVGDSPEAWWRLNEAGGTNMLDSMGRHPGSYQGGVTLGVSGLPFSAATAASFDGQNGGTKTMGSVPYTPILNNEIFTVEAWVQTANETANMGVVSSHGGSSSSPYKGKGYFMMRDSSANFDGDIGLNDQYLYYYITLNPSITNKWTQVAMTYGTGGLNLYQDGALVQGGFGDFVRNTSAPFMIGYVDPFILDYAWNGKIADVAYYTTALTAAQLNNHYQAALYGSTSKPIFTILPQSQTVVVGNTVTLTAHAEGSSPIGLQWLKNSSPIAGATNSSLTLANVFFTDAGSYQLMATNAVGSSNSAPAVLTVVPVPHFVNATNGLVLHLKFDGDVTDSSGRGNNGTAVGGPAFVAGKIGTQALQVTTVTDSGLSGGNVTSAGYVDLGLVPDLQFSSNVDFSVSMWVKFPTNAVPGDLPFFGNALNSTFNIGYLMAPSYKTGGWAWSLGDLGGNTPISATGAAGSINNGSWHSLVYTFTRSGDAITYLDGQAVDSTFDLAGGDVDSGYNTIIGQDPSGIYPEPATFALDDIGVWRRALTSYEAYAINYVGNAYGSTFDTYGPELISIQKVAGGYAVIFQAGTLLSSSTLNGTYTPVAGAAAPYYQFVPGAGPKFFRVKL